MESCKIVSPGIIIVLSMLRFHPREPGVPSPALRASFTGLRFMPAAGQLHKSARTGRGCPF